MIIYKEYKEIEIKDIKGCNINVKNTDKLNSIYSEIKAIEKDSIRKPIEVIEENNGYRILHGDKKLLAAKMLGYQKIPCLVRDLTMEIFLRKVMKNLRLKEEDLYI